jgi:hypothetical protein
MTYPDDQIQELKALCPGVASAEEGGKPFLLLPKLKLPPGASIHETDALLCPVPTDGYESRIYFPVRIDSPKALNWNVNGAVILGRQWFAHSWKTRANLRLAQMVLEHLFAFHK